MKSELEPIRRKDRRSALLSSIIFAALQRARHRDDALQRAQDVCGQ